jgi:hypothetical protein
MEAIQAGFDHLLRENPTVCRYKAKKWDSSGKYGVFLVFNATWRAEFVEKLLKLRRSFAIIGLESHWSTSGRM